MIVSKSNGVYNSLDKPLIQLRHTEVGRFSLATLSHEMVVFFFACLARKVISCKLSNGGAGFSERNDFGRDSDCLEDVFRGFLTFAFAFKAIKQ